ncbi:MULTISPECIES: hypothetical protein [Burkholderia cepacia complex]|uniref:hypothetical protein n=1 Tax=Burkholderia cepacia complex TaxID=87882 RepID=UPI000F5F13C8|nr:MULTISPECIES: hypothetical protein [Burkholderia cepacia complex]MCA8054355.1 hypothetical protein [Burkholderia cepacia]
MRYLDESKGGATVHERSATALRATFCGRWLYHVGILLQDSLKEQEHDDGRECAQPNFHHGHASTPAR